MGFKGFLTMERSVPISPPFTNLPKPQIALNALILNDFYPNLVSDCFRKHPLASFQKGLKRGETFFSSWHDSTTKYYAGNELLQTLWSLNHD